MTDAEVDILLERFDQTDPVLQRQIVAQLVADRSVLGANIDKLRNALLRLCRELQCPAMEYMNPAIQNAWSDAFDLVDPQGIKRT